MVSKKLEMHLSSVRDNLDKISIDRATEMWLYYFFVLILHVVVLNWNNI